MANKLIEQIEQAQMIIDELNNLDYKSKDEDPLFCENLARLESLHEELSGKPQMIKPKTNKFLQ